MHDDTIELRQPGPDELRAWVEPTGAAFADTFTDAEFVHELKLWEPDRLIGAVDGGKWVGTGGAYSFGLTVPGGEIGAAGITMIGVSPSHRRRGILRQMMRWLLDQSRERGELACSPVGVRECHLPAFRVRDGDAPVDVRRRAESGAFLAPGRAAGADADR
ncbi:MAG TPA: GNAT family N-acetyltransferase, partial [Candidatus Limnocylindrales bacterium]